MDIRIVAKTDDGFEKSITYIGDLEQLDRRERTIEIDLKEIKSADTLIITIEN